MNINSLIVSFSALAVMVGVSTIYAYQTYSNKANPISATESISSAVIDAVVSSVSPTETPPIEVSSTYTPIPTTIPSNIENNNSNIDFDSKIINLKETLNKSPYDLETGKKIIEELKLKYTGSKLENKVSQISEVYEKISKNEKTIEDLNKITNLDQWNDKSLMEYVKLCLSDYSSKNNKIEEINDVNLFKTFANQNCGNNKEINFLTQINTFNDGNGSFTAFVFVNDKKFKVSNNDIISMN
jgi:hypothetical protein